MIDPDIRKIFQPELKRGEILRWAGRPTGIKIDPTIAIFSAVLSIIGVIIFTKLDQLTLTTWFISGALFLSCLWWIFLPAMEYYAVTNRRVIFYRPLTLRQFIFIPKSKIENVSVVQRFGDKKIALSIAEGPFGSTYNHASIGFSIGPMKWSRIVMHGIEHPDVLANIILHKE